MINLNKLYLYLQLKGYLMIMDLYVKMENDLISIMMLKTKFHEKINKEN